jgi:sterol desaturase/sphingolipid hydroxylase (fatty acid hydroxylase superfamily)
MVVWSLVAFLLFNQLTSHRTIGFAAEWAHPLEHILANQLTMTVAMALMGVHGFTWLCWLAFRLWDTFQHHSGYSLPWMSQLGTEVHDFHHTTNVGNFASEFMDCLFGTNELWVQKQRLRMKSEQDAARGSKAKKVA